MKDLNPINYTFQQLSSKCLACRVDVMSRGRYVQRLESKELCAACNVEGNAAGRSGTSSRFPELFDMGTQ